MVIRSAVESDCEQIAEIYNHVLLTSTAIYRDAPLTREERDVWIAKKTEKNYPLIVAIEEESLVGFATYDDFRPWPGYRFTVEGSVHLREDARGRGLGRDLLAALLQHASEAGKHMMIAGVDAENVASRRFLQKFGAEEAGCLRQVGYKFGRYLDLVFFQIPITDKDSL